MSKFYKPGMIAGNYAKTESFTYTNYINPLAKLNISGTIFSLIYKSTMNEILGNSWHKAIWNSNILEYYLDFYSQNIPQSFYLGGFSPGGFLIAAQYDHFTIAITPVQSGSNYPAQIEVKASTGYPDDSFIYKYYY